RAKAVCGGVWLLLLGGMPAMLHAGLQVQSADTLPASNGGRADALLVAFPAVEREGAQAGQAAALTWHEAVRIAVTRHPTVLAAQANVQQRSSLIDAARAGYRPRVQAE